MLRTFAKTLLASLLCAAAISASAAPILIKESGLGNGQWTNSLTLPMQSTPANYWAGLQTLVIDNADTVLAFCVDPWELSPTSNQSYETGDLAGIFGSSTANFINELYSKFYASTLENTVAGANAAAGFQLALWEIIADHDFKLDGTGLVATNAKTNQTIVGIANEMLSQLNGILGDDLYSFTFYTSGASNGEGSSKGFQDYLVATKVPEPASALLLVTALGGLLLRRRQK
ncbi:MAG: PEP-CTERM sorting domain-containing protein [Azonexus sp.]|jgi:hypothetical protein|uniref:PEP-CTERM sorting domain-containing protein n=1 Tax=Azonexus sp. TaxID=1872668 RepID=UPI002824B158|nr:PEP-CTERM sorting domain-containing protein [Azonexus sp.]MDR0777321.1 PEP-CTERM sorting domain-containing protein [Azonexus sp.]